MSKPIRIRNDLGPLLRALPRKGGCAVFTHVRPEGDAIGSLLAMSAALEQRGVRAMRFCADAVPSVYRFLPGSNLIRRRTPSSLPEIAIVVDCDGAARLGPLGATLDRFKTLINIDHHGGNRPFGTVNWIEPDAPAASEMLYRLLKAMGAKITPEIATCLYTGILTDTGRFSNASANLQALDAAAALVRLGADPARIAAMVYESRPIGATRLLGAALRNLAAHGGGRLITSYLTLDDFERCGAAQEDTEGIVDHLRGIRAAEAAALFTEQEDGTVRISLRSRGRVNVARAATALGGGGHPSAAGCIVPGPLRSAMRRVLIEVGRIQLTGDR